MNDDSPAPKPSSFVIGQPLDTLSIEEIHETIDQLKEEIGRLENALAQKTQHRDAADALFGKK